VRWTRERRGNLIIFDLGVKYYDTTDFGQKDFNTTAPGPCHAPHPFARDFSKSFGHLLLLFSGTSPVYRCPLPSGGPSSKTGRRTLWEWFFWCGVIEILFVVLKSFCPKSVAS
jgi:hypothetical protein